jgi:hypothetical protein
MTKNSNVSETVAVMPVAISQIPMSDVVDALPKWSSKHINSQHEVPI